MDDDKVHAMVRNGAMHCGGPRFTCQCSSVLSFNASLDSAECQIELHFRGTRDPVLERPWANVRRNNEQNPRRYYQVKYRISKFSRAPSLLWVMNYVDFITFVLSPSSIYRPSREREISNFLGLFRVVFFLFIILTVGREMGNGKYGEKNICPGFWHCGLLHLRAYILYYHFTPSGLAQCGRSPVIPAVFHSEAMCFTDARRDVART